MSYTFTRSDTFEEADFDAAYEGDKAAVEELLFEKISVENISVIGSAKSFFRQTFILNKENNNGFFVKITKTREDGSQSLVGISVSYLDGDNNFCTPIGIATANSEFIAMDAQWYYSYIDFENDSTRYAKHLFLKVIQVRDFGNFLNALVPI